MGSLPPTQPEEKINSPGLSKQADSRRHGALPVSPGDLRETPQPRADRGKGEPALRGRLPGARSRLSAGSPAPDAKP